MLSLVKILLICAVVAALWYGYGVLDRRERARRGELDEHGAKRTAVPGADEMIQCPKCGDFVVKGGAKACDRPGCPAAGL